MLRHLVRAYPTASVILAMLVVSLVAGIVADAAMRGSRSPIDRARDLARTGNLAAAEQAYVELAERSPGDVPLLLELLDNHELIVRAFALRDDETATPSGRAGVAPKEKPMEEARIDALFARDLPPDVALVGRFWREVTRGHPSDADRAPVLAAAKREPPIPWANHVLGREAQRADRDDEAATLYAREASAFDDRKHDAETASLLWIESGDWESLGAALRDPRFAHQVDASVRLRYATHQRDWAGAVRWFLPSQYEGASLGILLLAGLSALVWFAIAATLGLALQPPRWRILLYAAALLLGVASTYLTMAIIILETDVFHFVEKGNPLADAIYFVFGVGLREEACKALLLLPLVPIIKKWGRRREALACGALVGLGFAAEENIGYFHLGLSTALSRFLTANFLHMATTGLVAVAIDDAVRGLESEGGDLWKTVMLVVAAHGFYDFFLSNPSVDRGSFLSMFVFFFLSRRFVDIIRGLPGREGPLLRFFTLGLSLVVAASFVFASTLVGPKLAALAMAQGLLGMAIVVYMFVHELKNV
jgi:RsiW-degrading membrane proteinase PrsW (M82 family)